MKKMKMNTLDMFTGSSSYGVHCLLKPCKVFDGWRPPMSLDISLVFVSLVHCGYNLCKMHDSGDLCITEQGHTIRPSVHSAKF